MRKRKFAILSILTVSSIATPVLSAACNDITKSTKDYTKLVMVSVENASQKFAKDIQKQDIRVFSTDKSLTLQLSDVVVSKDNKKITIAIKVVDNSTKTETTITKELSGFKTQNKTPIAKDYNKLVSVSVDDASSKHANEIKKEDVKISSNDKDLSFEISSLNVSEDKTKVIVVIKVVDNSTKTQTTITKELSGFKSEKHSEPIEPKITDEKQKQHQAQVEQAYKTFKEHTKINISKKSWEFLSKASDKSIIYYDSKTKSFYEKPFDTNNIDVDRNLLFKLDSNAIVPEDLSVALPEGDQSDSHIYDKVSLVKQDGKFGIKFRISESKLDKHTLPLPNKVEQSNLFSIKDPTEQEVDQVLNNLTIDYPNKANTSVEDVNPLKLILPRLKGFNDVKVINIERNPLEGKVIVEVKLTWMIGNDKLESKSRKIEISGFKKLTFDEILNGIQLNYEGEKVKTLPSQVTNDKIKVLKDALPLDDYINVSFKLIPNDAAGSLTIEATFKIGKELRVKNFSIDGFKKIATLEQILNEYSGPTLKNNKDRSQIFTSQVEKEMIELPAIDSNTHISVQIEKVEVNRSDVSKLNVTLVFSNSQTKESKKKVYVLESFKITGDVATQLAENKMVPLFVFKGEQNAKDKIKEYLKNGQNRVLLKFQSGKFYTKDPKTKKDIELKGLVFNPELEKDWPNYGKIIITHGRFKSLASANAESGKVLSRNNDGVDLVLENNNVKLKFKTLQRGNIVGPKTYEIVLFDSTTTPHTSNKTK
ncbi:hypothetical protein E1I18_00895 [Mycoplasmopsis mucosicanis]|uniref:Lipoprotein-associated type-17 domain-containing protein n=1 Tax=Mycoplasmopsis mucosicanis TaxID=458208 RepID=A0A507SXL8_9BACT|nr:lipoprotein 17-related variable surface protein [Mycoplasmopsis mucosicanis]TQC54002.1 hypothetical protein E1I18_00895 [Mycoplasmopsis mucosicanis]